MKAILISINRIINYSINIKYALKELEQHIAKNYHINKSKSFQFFS